MPEKVGIGIIGCGGMGRHHARNWQKSLVFSYIGLV